MIIEEGYILLAAAQLVAKEAGRAGWSLDSMTKNTLETFRKLKQELKKPENL